MIPVISSTVDQLTLSMAAFCAVGANMANTTATVIATRPILNLNTSAEIARANKPISVDSLAPSRPLTACSGAPAPVRSVR